MRPVIPRPSIVLVPLEKQMDAPLQNTGMPREKQRLQTPAQAKTTPIRLFQHKIGIDCLRFGTYRRVIMIFGVRF
jgi:hypothetical protein